VNPEASSVYTKKTFNTCVNRTCEDADLAENWDKSATPCGNFAIGGISGFV